MIAKKILRVTSWVLMAVLALIILFNLTCKIKRIVFDDTCPTVFGFGTFVVETGSMEPTISAFDLIVIHEQKEYTVGDIVTYEADALLPITHRIVNIRSDENGNLWVETKGDANNAPDREEFPIDQIAGKVILTIPRFGYWQNFLQQPAGFLLLTLLVCFLIILPDLINKLQKRKDDEH